MKSRAIFLIQLVMLMVVSSSCLKMGLDELPKHSESDIENFYFEYRWMDTSGQYEQLRVEYLDTEVDYDYDAKEVICIVRVPEASKNFTEEIREEVELSNIVGSADISLAATMTPIGKAPNLGVIADFSGSNMNYRVTAADGTHTDWKLTIVEFIK